MNIMTKLKLVLFAALLGVATLSVADKPLFPGLLPLEEGVIQHVDQNTGELVVGDTAYRIDANTAVKNSNGLSGSLGGLSKGASVRLYLHPSVLEEVAYQTYVHGVELR